jgi:hypothetical protein
MTATHSKFSAFLTFALSIVVLALVATLFARHYRNLPYTITNTTTTSAATSSGVDCAANIETVDCSRGRVCEVPYHIPDMGVCIQTPAVPGTACESVCYVEDATTTACTATGTCEGNWTESLGYCTTDADCNASIPFNEEWLYLVDNVSLYADELPLFWGIRYSCYFNRCMMFTLDRVFQSHENEIVGNILMFAQCHDFLNRTFFTGDLPSCITTENHLLQPNLTNAIFAGVPGFDTSAYEPQLRMCTFYYGNSRINHTAVEDWNKKRSVESTSPCRYSLKNLDKQQPPQQLHNDHQLAVACQLSRNH